MVNDPELVPRNALKGRRIALSVSESDDLARLGLYSVHLDLAVAELTRAILFAGGTVVYGGRINWGFTNIVLDEAERYRSDAQRYGVSAGAFEHYVPYSEHSGIAEADLLRYAGGLSVKARVRFLDATGVARDVADISAASFARGEVDSSKALTAMRKVTSDVSDARVVLGGKVVGFAGAFPGVAEEAALTATLGKPLFIAGGFGEQPPLSDVSPTLTCTSGCLLNCRPASRPRLRLLCPTSCRASSPRTACRATTVRCLLRPTVRLTWQLCRSWVCRN
ncbi:hypothetical protein LT337_09085 [Mycolicibacterium fortuitum]|nr:hypothetical protein LT337_09085 [Mycolicibacterium fortuitum]